jgi:hypothetical protein
MHMPSSATQSVFAVQADVTAALHEPPEATALWKHVSHASPVVAFIGVVAQSSVAHAVWQGALHASMVPPEELLLLELPLLLLLELPLLLPPLPLSGGLFDVELLPHPPTVTVRGTIASAITPNKRFTLTAFLPW